MKLYFVVTNTSLRADDYMQKLQYILAYWVADRQPWENPDGRPRPSTALVHAGAYLAWTLRSAWVYK